MRHLSPAQLVDLAEGTEPEASRPHLQSCESCRGKLAELRAMMSATADVDVPEPSPLFWDHLAARVHEAVEAEGPTRRASLLYGFGWPKPGEGGLGAPKRSEGGWSWSRLALPLSIGAVAAVAVLIAAVLTLRVGRLPVAGPAQTLSMADPLLADPVFLQDDPSLDLVAALAADVDWDLTGETGLTTHQGSADKAVSQLTDAERRELQRLLREELERAGA